MGKGTVKMAGRLSEGDVLAERGAPKVLRVTRAQGRKPARGENLHVHTRNTRYTFNTLDPVRVIR